MVRRLTHVAAAVLVFMYTVIAAWAGDKPEPSVTYAKTWDAAVEEAKTLNLPIVVHSHGFF